MKSEETLLIEQLLSTYDPETLGGCKLNKFRHRYLAYECPVTTGTTADGLVDLMRVDEILVNGRKSFYCGPGHHKEWYLKNNPKVLTYIQGNECGITSIEDLPEYCDCATCTARTYSHQYDNEICITAFEIKVTKSDFHSPHGHNFCGNANYYVMPKELYAKVKDEIPEDIGVIVKETTKNGTDRLRRVKECQFRHMLDCDMKWKLLNILKKQVPYPIQNLQQEHELDF